MLFFEEAKAPSTGPRQPRIPEFQGIILAGQGNNLSILPEEDSVLPKALLPVAGRPMICYPLEWLEKAGVLDVMILAHGPAGPRIAHALKSAYNGAAEVRVLTLEGPALGSADALAQVKDKIKHDIVVLGCDLITDVDPHTFLDYHRASTPSVTALLYEPKWEAGTPPKENPFSGLIGVDRKSRDLLLMTPLDEEEVRLRNSLLWKYPSIDLYTCLQDAHAYVMKRWVVDFLVGKPKLASIREDLLPLLAKAQYKRGMVGAQGLDAYTSPSGSALFQEALAISSTTSPVAKDPSLPSVKAYISRDVYTQRVNTLANYAEVNRYLIKDWAGDRVAKTAEIAARTQIGQDSLVGEGSRIDERSSVKRSVLGSGCRIGKGCKIVNSILMDNVAIDDNVKLEGCIIGEGGRIGERSALRDCLVGVNAVVPKETQEKNEEFEREDN